MSHFVNVTCCVVQVLICCRLLFLRAPFTLQRITELALRPERFYKSLRKLLFALEKVCSSTSSSTQTCFSICLCVGEQLVTVITTLPVWDGNPLVDDDNEAQNDDNLRSLPEAVYLDEVPTLFRFLLDLPPTLPLMYYCIQALIENVPVPMEIETTMPES